MPANNRTDNTDLDNYSFDNWLKKERLYQMPTNNFNTFNIMDNKNNTKNEIKENLKAMLLDMQKEPRSRELSLAITRLEEAIMWFNKCA